MAALQLNKRHFNEDDNTIVTRSGDAAFGHSGDDEFNASGHQLSFWAGGAGSDIYDLEDFSGFVAITENAGEGNNDKLTVSADLFDVSKYYEDGPYLASDLEVYSVDHRHLFIKSESLDQKIVIADGLNDFGNVDFVRMVADDHVSVVSSSLVFDDLLSSDHYMGNVSSRDIASRDIAIALDDVTYESQVVSQIEDKFADRGITWDSAKDYVTNALDNPEAVYVAANLSGLNTEMLGVLVGVSTDTVNEYFTANGFDPAGLA